MRTLRFLLSFTRPWLALFLLALVVAYPGAARSEPPSTAPLQADEEEEEGVERGIEGGVSGGWSEPRTAVEKLDEAERVYAPFDDSKMAAELKALLAPPAPERGQQEGESEAEPDCPGAAAKGAVRVEGRVLLGGYPLAGELDLRQVDGSGRACLRLAEDGSFQGRLPEGGAWHATIHVGFETLLDVNVTVSPNAAGEARLDINAPGTRLYGRMVDPHGKPIPLARIYLWGDGPERKIRADGYGNFQILGLPPGHFGLRGGGVPGGCTSESDPRLGEELEVDLLPGQDLGPLTLRLLPVRRVVGRLTGLGKPWPSRSYVQAVTQDGTATFGFVDEEGAFAVDLPLETTEATLVVPQGNGTVPIHLFPLPLDGTEPTLALSEGKGKVAIELPATGEALTAAGQILEVAVDGRLIPAYHLGGRMLEFLDRRSFDLPIVPPGHYRVCLGPSRLFDRFDPDARKAGKVTCAEGDLKAGETLRLALGPPA